MTALSISSPAFGHEDTIPKKFGYKHGNSSPPLTIRNVPDGCRSLALIMDDPDAMGAVGKVWVHWLVWNIPPDTSDFGESDTPSGCMEGRTDFGEARYGGPAPPDKRHTYIFTLYALDDRLNLRPGSDKKDLEKAMRGHIIEQGTLHGTFAP